MIYIYNDSLDPYFNLAAEEYLLKSKQEEVLMLWQNENTVVVGKNQNTLEEIDTDFVREHNVHVVRRMTGGGAVFHDKGNVNYTFIVNDGDKVTDFGFFTRPIIEALSEIGIHAELKGRNDLQIDEKKISGNAQCAWKGRVMHHGTLLFRSDISTLADALRVKPGKIESKGIKSVSARVANIADYLHFEMTSEQFISHLEGYFLSADEIVPYTFTPEDKIAITRLKEEKYGTWEWNYGYSPQYDFVKEIKFKGGIVTVGVHVENGIIQALSLRGDYFGTKDSTELCKKMTGIRHEYHDVLQRLCELGTEQYIWGMDAITLTEAMF